MKVLIVLPTQGACDDAERSNFGNLGAHALFVEHGAHLTLRVRIVIMNEMLVPQTVKKAKAWSA